MSCYLHTELQLFVSAESINVLLDRACQAATKASFLQAHPHTTHAVPFQITSGECRRNVACSAACMAYPHRHHLLRLLLRSLAAGKQRQQPIPFQLLFVICRLCGAWFFRRLCQAATEFAFAFRTCPRAVRHLAAVAGCRSILISLVVRSFPAIDKVLYCS